jgi:superfamily II DNA/RNA helicase
MIIIPQEEIGAQLPEVVVLQKYCELTPEQQEINNKLLSELEELHEKEKVLQQNPEENKEELAKIEANIMMRQTFAQELADSEELLSLSDSLSAKNYISNTESNKMNLLIDLLEEILNSGEKVCIFSRFTKMQDIITNRISKEKSNIFKDIEIAYINGSLNTNARYDEVYNKFRDNENCKILCCSDAGAEGINLSWCRYVIEVDLANSYAIQQQRHGRVKRADSTHKTVFVYQLICENSYDEIAQKIVNKKEYYDKTIINGIKIE